MDNGQDSEGKVRTSDGPKWTAQSGGNQGEEGVVNSGKGQMCTPDSPKWSVIQHTRRPQMDSPERKRQWVGWGEGWGWGEKLPLQTALNGRPRAG